MPRYRPAAPGLIAALLAACLAACGSNSTGAPDAGEPDGGHDAGNPGIDAGHDAGTPEDAGTDAGMDAGLDAGLLSGHFIAGPGIAPGPYMGVHYSAGDINGATDDAGTFSYPAGAQVDFSVGGLSLGTVPGAPVVTPFSLSGGCTITPQLTQLLVFLQSLDGDGNPANGVQLPAYPAVLSGSLASLTRAQVAADIAQLSPGTTPVADQAALDLFIMQVDGEAWTQQSMDTFDLLSSGIRSQGAATDGTDWLFSWRFGLSRTDMSYSVQVKNLEDIPALLLAQGSDHIGDIDVAGGWLYAGIEDSAHYQHPLIARYDPQSLDYQISFPIDVTKQPDGVPWVAYDGDADEAFSSPWSPSPGINVFDGNDSMAFLRTIPLSPALDRIQGAKLWHGFMYASADISPLKTVWKINLDTGTAMAVLQMDLGTVEEEGLVFLERGDGTAMHTMNANSGSTAMEFRHHARTIPPLRDSICP